MLSSFSKSKYIAGVVAGTNSFYFNKIKSREAALSPEYTGFKFYRILRAASSPMKQSATDSTESWMLSSRAENLAQFEGATKARVSPHSDC
jgi:glycine betaine/choline ABC-type transport system substrate-binding protein